MYRREFLRLGVATAAACAGIVTLSGCSGAVKPSDAYGVRTIRVATGGEKEPYSYIDSKGTWTGFCADAWKRVGEITGWTVEVVDSGSVDSAFADLMAGKADVVANGCYITEKRLKLYLPCDPLFGDAQLVTVGPNSDVKALDDLGGGTVGVVSGSSTQDSVEDLSSTYAWRTKEYKLSGQAGKDCVSGAIDAYADYVTNIGGVEQSQKVELKKVGDPVGGNNVAWFTLSSEKELRDDLNKVIKVMREDGSLSKLTTTWFNGDLTGYVSDAWPIATS